MTAAVLTNCPSWTPGHYPGHPPRLLPRPGQSQSDINFFLTYLGFLFPVPRGLGQALFLDLPLSGPHLQIGPPFLASPSRPLSIGSRGDLSKLQI